MQGFPARENLNLPLVLFGFRRNAPFVFERGAHSNLAAPGSVRHVKKSPKYIKFPAPTPKNKASNGKWNLAPHAGILTTWKRQSAPCYVWVSQLPQVHVRVIAHSSLCECIRLVGLSLSQEATRPTNHLVYIVEVSMWNVGPINLRGVPIVLNHKTFPLIVCRMHFET